MDFEKNEFIHVKTGLNKNGHTFSSAVNRESDKVFFVRNVVGNECGVNGLWMMWVDVVGTDVECVDLIHNSI